MKNAAVTALVILSIAPPVLAQDGAYFGAGIAFTDSSSTADIVPDDEFSGTDFGLALTAGYRAMASGNLAYGVEGNLDLMSGETLSGSSDACSNASPTWCEVDSILRIRGTLGTVLAGGDILTGSLGGVVISGRAEDGPNNYVDTVGTGISFGASWELVGSSMPLRFDFNYDSINSDDADNYQRDLDVIGLRASYMF